MQHMQLATARSAKLQPYKELKKKITKQNKQTLLIFQKWTKKCKIRNNSNNNGTAK